MLKLSNPPSPKDGFEPRSKEICELSTPLLSSQSQYYGEANRNHNKDADSNIYRVSPLPHNGPTKDVSSPGFTDLTSKQTDKCSSKDLSEEKFSETYNSLGITVNECSIIGGSVSLLLPPVDVSAKSHISAIVNANEHSANSSFVNQRPDVPSGTLSIDTKYAADFQRVKQLKLTSHPSKALEYCPYYASFSESPLRCHESRDYISSRVSNLASYESQPSNGRYAPIYHQKAYGVNKPFLDHPQHQSFCTSSYHSNPIADKLSSFEHSYRGSSGYSSANSLHLQPICQQPSQYPPNSSFESRSSPHFVQSHDFVPRFAESPSYLFSQTRAHKLWQSSLHPQNALTSEGFVTSTPSCGRVADQACLHASGAYYVKQADTCKISHLQPYGDKFYSPSSNQPHCNHYSSHNIGLSTPDQRISSQPMIIEGSRHFNPLHPSNHPSHNSFPHIALHRSSPMPKVDYYCYDVSPMNNSRNEHSLAYESKPFNKSDSAQNYRPKHVDTIQQRSSIHSNQQEIQCSLKGSCSVSGSSFPYTYKQNSRKRSHNSVESALNKKRKLELFTGRSQKSKNVPVPTSQLISETDPSRRLGASLVLSSKSSQQHVITRPPTDAFLRGLLQVDANRLLQEPLLSAPIDLLAPLPSPCFIHPSLEPDGLPRRLLSSEQLDAEQVSAHWGRKYSLFPFSLSPNLPIISTEGISNYEFRNMSFLEKERNFYQAFLHYCISDLEMLSAAAKRGTNPFGLLHRLRGRNYLASLVKKSILRGFQAPTNHVREEATTVDIDLLVRLKLDDPIEISGRTTPPLEMRTKAYNNITEKPNTSFPTRPLYSEEVMSLMVLKAADCSLICHQCCCQIFPTSDEQSTALVLRSEDEVLRFCSYACLNHFRYFSAKTLSNYCTSSHANHNDIRVIIQPSGGGKLSKGAAKKIVGSGKTRRMKSDSMSRSANSALASHSWRGIRWLRYSPSAFSEYQSMVRRDAEESSENQLLLNGPALRLPSYVNETSNSSAISARRKRRTHIPCGELQKLELFPGSQTALIDNQKTVRDTRVCRLCHTIGDARSDVAGRLLSYGANTWVHVNCALWSYEAFETVSGCLVDVHLAIKKADRTICHLCRKIGARLPCFESQCPAVFHLPCAHEAGCSFHVDRSMYCPHHRGVTNGASILDSLAVRRRVYIDRDEGLLVAKVIIDSDLAERGELGDFGELNKSTVPMLSCPFVLRIGSLTLRHIGQLLPDQLISGRFHTPAFIYPVGYSVSRLFWSYRRVHTRCRYECRIEERLVDQDAELLEIKSSRSCQTRPWFVIYVDEPGQPSASFESSTCDGVWQKVLALIDGNRRNSSDLPRKIFPKHMCGEILYGLTEPHLVRVIESLPGVEHLTDYVFKFGRLQLISEMPLAVNPTGCARSEPKLRTYVRRNAVSSSAPNSTERIFPAASLLRHPSRLHASQATANMQAGRTITGLGPDPHFPCFFPSSSPVSSSTSLSGNSKALVSGSTASLSLLGLGVSNSLPGNAQSKSQQYRRLKVEWKTNVLLARSRIQGLGLFAARDIDKHAFIIEYLGETIRNEVANRRERLYESQNRGVYMFRADDDCIVDATMCGGLARYVNHSCEPNCIAEVINFDNSSHIIIIAHQKISKGEELTYDYKFDIEEERWDRIPCLCGAQTCRKWMN